MLKRKKRSVKLVLFRTTYKVRRVGGELYRLLELRKLQKTGRVRYVCIAIGTKALHGVADRLNLIPHQ